MALEMGGEIAGSFLNVGGANSQMIPTSSDASQDARCLSFKIRGIYEHIRYPKSHFLIFKHETPNLDIIYIFTGSTVRQPSISLLVFSLPTLAPHTPPYRPAN